MRRPRLTHGGRLEDSARHGSTPDVWSVVDLGPVGAALTTTFARSGVASGSATMYPPLTARRAFSWSSMPLASPPTLRSLERSAPRSLSIAPCTREILFIAHLLITH